MASRRGEPPCVRWPTPQPGGPRFWAHRPVSRPLWKPGASDQSGRLYQETIESSPGPSHSDTFPWRKCPRSRGAWPDPLRPETGAAMSSVAIVPDPQPAPSLPAPPGPTCSAPSPRPKSLVEHLDRHVVGQQTAKRKLAVAVSNHFRRLADGERGSGRVAGTDPLADAPDLADVVVERSNVLLIGPSGSGKTLLVTPWPRARRPGRRRRRHDVHRGRLRRRRRGEPADEAPPGRRGRLRPGPGRHRLHRRDRQDAEAPALGPSRDITGEGVQQALLKMIEGFMSFIPTRLGPRQPDSEIEPFDTTGGAVHLRRGLPRPGGDHLEAARS